MFMEMDFASGHGQAMLSKFTAEPAFVIDDVEAAAEFLGAADIGRLFAPAAVEQAFVSAKQRFLNYGWRDRNGALSESERRDISFLAGSEEIYSRVHQAWIDAKNAEDQALAAGRHSLKHAMQTFCAYVAYRALEDERWIREQRLQRAGFGWASFAPMPKS